MRFEVRAVLPDNKMTTAFIEANDEAAATQIVESRRMRLVSIKQAGRNVRTRRQRRGGFSLLMFSVELLSLLDAGLSLVESLEALVEKETSAESRAVMDALIARMREGMRFSDSVAMQAEFFPPLYVGIVRAAERTSDLPRALSRYVDYQTRLEAVRGRVVSATIYPAILFSVGGLVGLFLMLYVVPRFAAVYHDSGRKMPWMSQVLMSCGEFLGSHALAVGISLAVIGFLALSGWRKLMREGRLLQLVGVIPGVAERVRLIELSRLYLTLGMLLEGGIPIVSALELIEDAVSAEGKTRLRAARSAIANGAQMSSAFEAHGLSTPIALRMLRVGERSGQLGQMLTRSALFYEGESTRWIERFSKVFEPVLMACIGVVVGLIVILLYMPIFDLAGSLQ